MELSEDSKEEIKSERTQEGKKGIPDEDIDLFLMIAVLLPPCFAVLFADRTEDKGVTEGLIFRVGGGITDGIALDNLIVVDWGAVEGCKGAAFKVVCDEAALRRRADDCRKDFR